MEIKKNSAATLMWIVFFVVESIIIGFLIRNDLIATISDINKNGFYNFLLYVYEESFLNILQNFYIFLILIGIWIFFYSIIDYFSNKRNSSNESVKENNYYPKDSSYYGDNYYKGTSISSLKSLKTKVKLNQVAMNVAIGQNDSKRLYRLNAELNDLNNKIRQSSEELKKSRSDIVSQQTLNKSADSNTNSIKVNSEFNLYIYIFTPIILGLIFSYFELEWVYFNLIFPNYWFEAYQSSKFIMSWLLLSVLSLPIGHWAAKNNNYKDQFFSSLNYISMLFGSLLGGFLIAAVIWFFRFSKYDMSNNIFWKSMFGLSLICLPFFYSSVKKESTCSKCLKPFVLEENGQEDYAHSVYYKKEYISERRITVNVPYNVRHYFQYMMCVSCGYKYKYKATEETRADENKKYL